MNKKLFAVVIAASALMFSCAKSNNDADTALVVNGQKISSKEIDETADFFYKQQLQLFPEKAFEGMGSEIRQSAARQLAANILMLEEIKNRKWVADSETVAATFSAMISKFSDKDAFLKELSAMGETEGEFRQHLAEELLLDSLLNELMASSDTADEKECKEYYEANKARYMGAPRVRASQILFSLNKSSDSAETAASFEKAQKVLLKARGGEDFDRLAKEYSSIPLPADIGWFKKGDLIPDLEKVLFTLKNGEVSDVIKSSLGFHILKKTDEENGRQLKYEEVRDFIKKTLDLTRKSKNVNGFIDSLIAAADIEYVDTTLKVPEGMSTQQLIMGNP